METLFKIFFIPIFILNFFGFFVSAIWLLVLGEWRSLLGGFVAILAASWFALPLALLPGFLFAGPAMYMANRRITIGIYFFGLLSSLYSFAVMTAWCGAVTYGLLNGASSSSFWPLLIWAYTVATAPWTYMAREDQSVASFLAAFMGQVAYIVMMLALAIFSISTASAMQVFAVVIAIGVILHMRLLVDMHRAKMFESL